MSRIGHIGAATSTGWPSGRDRAERSEAHDGREGSRALVPVVAPASRSPRHTGAPARSAAFLAHVIATAADAPQTRARRRASEAEAAAAYAAASGLVAGSARHRRDV